MKYKNERNGFCLNCFDCILQVSATFMHTIYIYIYIIPPSPLILVMGMNECGLYILVRVEDNQTTIDENFILSAHVHKKVQKH